MDTVYIGGGTPSILYSGGITQILQAVKENFNLALDAEISMEANPKTVTEEKVCEYIAAGVNRFSVGLQSSENKALKASGRPHTFEDFLDTIGLLRDYGVKNINADIMLGLPEQSLKGAVESAETLVALELEHISAYGLILEQGTPLYKMTAQKKCILPTEDESADMYDAVYKIFEKAGAHRYEVSNFAREGFMCRHNLNYWRRGEYIGLGAAAHGFLGSRRMENTKDINTYIKKLSQGRTGKSTEMKIGIEDAEKEYIMLGLRLEEGLDTEKFEQIFLVDFFKKYETVLKKLYNIGLVYFDGRFLKIPSEKFRYLNRIILEFF